MTISNFDMLFYTLAFIVPGFLMDVVIRYFIPIKEDSTQKSILRFLWYSSINYGIWSWLIYFIFKNNFDSEHTFETAMFWLLIIFISPILVGLFISYITIKEWVRNLLHRIGFNPIHTIPTAWDYKFSKITCFSFIIITLNDGISVAGFYGPKSFASSLNGERDIYLEKVFEINEDEEWSEKVSEGIWISGSSIKTIEFLKGGENKENGRQE